MSDDLQALPDSYTDNQGQGEVMPEDAEYVQRKDLDNLRSIKDREVAEARRQAQAYRQELERARAEAARAQAAANEIQRVVREVDPASADVLTQAAELAQLKAENDQYRRQQADLQRQAQYQQQLNAWRNQQRQRGKSAGIEPGSPEWSQLEAAIQRAEQAGHNGPVDDALVDIKVKRATQHSQPQATQPRASSPLPPSGGSPVNSANKLMQDFQREKINLRQGDAEGLMRLKRKYRSMGLQV